MFKIEMNVADILGNAVDDVARIHTQREAEQAQYIELCKARLPNVPDDWELLTANRHTQSFKDNRGRVRTFDARTGAEING